MALGVYDGVHLGHRKVLERIRSLRQREGLLASVCTFRSDMPKPGFERIMGTEQLYRSLAKEGVDCLHTLEFNDGIKAMDGESFLAKVLVNGFGVRVLVVGSEARFGRDRATRAQDLVAVGEKLGLKVEVVPVVLKDGEELSSTRIRSAIRAGRIAEVEELLGEPYSVGGFVVRDQGRARKMGFPTANLRMEGRATLPFGVYSVWITTPDGPLVDQHRALAYVGQRPTVGARVPVLEVHIPGWEGDLYGRYLEVSGFEFIRGEVSFENLESLARQITKDLDVARSRWF